MSIYSGTASYYRAGIGSAASYQVSGKPFVTGSKYALSSSQRIAFPTVTKEVTATVRSATATDTMEIYFAADSPATNKFSLKVGSELVNTVTFDVKCSEIYVSSGQGVDWNIYASLTGIDIIQMPDLSGSLGISK